MMKAVREFVFDIPQYPIASYHSCCQAFQKLYTQVSDLE